MSWLRIRGPTKPFRARMRMPGDKSLAHRWLMLGPLGLGELHIDNLPLSRDVMATKHAMSALGVQFEGVSSQVMLRGVGLDGLRMPTRSLDCENSGTTMRLLAGLLAGQRFGSRLIGDESLSRRPMKRVVEPLRERGAMIAGSAMGAEITAPIHIAPLVDDERLSGIEVTLPIASAQVKSALLMSGLYADGPTLVSEPFLSRDHTERMLSAAGVALERAGSHIALAVDDWNRVLEFPKHVRLPGDVSSAAYFAAFCALVPESALHLEGILNNPTRTGFFSSLAAMGASIRARPASEEAFEPVADFFVRGGALSRGVDVGGEQGARMLDEVPILAVAAAFAHGQTRVFDAQELRGKESDRIRGTVDVLKAFGADATETDDGLIVHGGGKFHGAHVRTQKDHRLAMMAAIFASLVDAESTIEDAESIDVSFPGFVSELVGLGVDAVLIPDGKSG